MKAIIFGINGQDGFYLDEVCRENGYEVIGVSRSAGNWLQGSIAEREFVFDLIKKNQPDLVFHMAARSTTRHDALFENHETISTGTLNVLEAVKLFSPHSRVFITGSGVQFVNKGKPIHESDPFEASSPYSVARIQSVYAARYYRRLGIKSYVGYLFHHESPFRKGGHMSRFIVDSLGEIIAGKKKELEIGDITVNKEWGFAGDIAQGIFTLVCQDSVSEAVIGTGKAYRISDWLDICFSLAGLDWKQYVVEKKGNFIAEYPVLVSNPATMHALGWMPKSDIKDLAKMMLAQAGLKF